MGLVKPRELQPGEILSKNGHIIRPEKKLDKRAYHNMIRSKRKRTTSESVAEEEEAGRIIRKKWVR